VDDLVVQLIALSQHVPGLFIGIVFLRERESMLSKLSDQHYFAANITIACYLTEKSSLCSLRCQKFAPQRGKILICTCLFKLSLVFKYQEGNFESCTYVVCLT
jgi:hypothetical protein